MTVMTSRMIFPALLCVCLTLFSPQDWILSLPLCTFNQHPHADSRCRRQPTNNRHAHQPLFADLFIDQLPQTLCLQIATLELEQTIIIPPRLCIVT